VHSQTGSGCPAVKGFKKDIQEIRTRGATLGQAIASLPNSSIHSAITKTATEVTVEGGEAIHDLGGNACLPQCPKNGPPGKAIKRLFNVKACKPKLRPTPALKVNDVG
jgi:hypothetical protein